MKIIEKAKMPDGTEIQLEDWSENYPELFKYMIGAYPIAKRTSRYGFIRKHSKMRLGIAANKHMDYTNDDVVSDFESLKAGTKTLADLKEHFWNGKKDAWYLGMIPEWEANGTNW